jgi:hypothetical protein
MVTLPRLGRFGALWAALLVAAFLGGLAFDPTPARPVVRRGKYRVLEADLHAHTTFSDGSLTPLGLVRQAERRGLDVIALTEHNSVIPSQIARGWSRATSSPQRPRPIVLPSEEITTKRFHIIGIGLARTVAANQSAADVVRDIHSQGGIAIAAHPVAHFWPELLPIRSLFDGAEVMHPIAYRRGGGWSWADMVRYYEEASPPLMAIGSSDYHWGSVLGLCRTLVFVDGPPDAEPSEAAVLAALRAHRTVVYAEGGQVFGDPELVALLAREPYAARTSDLKYRGEGTADRVLRAVGWFGLVGLVFVGRGRKREANDRGRDG